MTAAEFIAAVVAQAPSLTDEQIDGIRRLLPPVPVDSTTVPAKATRTRKAA